MNYTSPIATMQTLQKAMSDGKWSIAKECFTNEMRRENAQTIGSRTFYLTDHWTKSVGVTNLFWPVLIFDKRANFVVASDSGSWAKIAVKHSPPREKDVRLQSVKLANTTDGWKVAELYEQTSPGKVAARETHGKP